MAYFASPYLPRATAEGWTHDYAAGSCLNLWKHDWSHLLYLERKRPLQDISILRTKLGPPDPVLS